MRKLLFILVLLLLPVLCLATNYYVSTAGNNSWDGLAPAYVSGTNGPWLTFTYADTQVSAGDTVEVRGGTYVEEVIWDADGTAVDRITITNYGDEEVIIDGQDTLPDVGTYTYLVRINGDYVTIQNITIHDSHRELFLILGDYSYAINITGDSSRGSGIVAAGDHNIIDGCSMTNNGWGYGFEEQTRWGSAICTVGTNTTIQNCLSYLNRGEGFNAYSTASYVTIQDNIAYNNGCGVYLDSCNHAVVRRNIFYGTKIYVDTDLSGQDWGPGSGIAIGDESQQPSYIEIYNNLVYGQWLSLVTNATTLNNVSITHNTFVNARKTELHLASGYIMNVYFRPTTVSFTNSVFKNNIILEEDSAQVPLVVNASHDGLTFAYNCYNKTWSTYSRVQEAHDVVDDPDLAKTGSTAAGELTGFYFKISGASPCIDAGTDLSITDDYFGDLRPLNYVPEMGGYEYRGRLTGWSYRKKITISNVNVGSNLTNFPVYVPIVGDTSIGAACESDGGDIRFTASDGSTELSYEKIGFAVAAGAADADFFVLVKPVTTAVDTVIYCYYGKSGATTTSAPTTVFDTTNNWVAVWHLEESGSGYLDATGNNNDSNAQTAPTRVAGKVGYGQQFFNAEYIQVPDSASLDIGVSDFSLSCWAQKTGGGIDYIIYHQDSDTTEGWGMLYGVNADPTKIQAFIKDTLAVQVTCNPAGTDLAYNTWYHIAFTCDRDNVDGFIRYKNGTAQGDVDPTGAATSIASTNKLYIGASSAIPGYPLTGILDEIRISNVVRPAAWGKFEFYNFHDGHAAGNELTWGQQEACGSNVSTLILF